MWQEGGPPSSWDARRLAVTAREPRLARRWAALQAKAVLWGEPGFPGEGSVHGPGARGHLRPRVVGKGGTQSCAGGNRGTVHSVHPSDKRDVLCKGPEANCLRRAVGAAGAEDRCGLRKVLGRFPPEKSARPQWQPVPPSVRVCNQHPSGPCALDLSKARQTADLARSWLAPPALSGDRTCRLVRRHVGLRSPLRVDSASGSAVRASRAARTVHKGRRPPGPPGIPARRALRAARPRPPPAQWSRGAGAQSARAGARESGGREEGLPARGRGGASGCAAEPSEFAPAPAPPPARRRPRGDVGCWWAPGSSGGGSLYCGR